MKGTQTITLSQEAIAEAMADYLNRQIKHSGVIVVGMITFERDATMSVDFEDEEVPTAQPAAPVAQDTKDTPNKTVTANVLSAALPDSISRNSGPVSTASNTTPKTDSARTR